MATPRKNWSRLFDQVLRMGWPDAVLADFIRLQAFMNGRWARDGLTPEEANEVVLSPQECMVVTATQNPRYYRLIDAFRAETGVPAILNTSFNENEPVVCRPKEAIDCFLRTKMDLLVIGSWMVRRT